MENTNAPLTANTKDSLPFKNGYSDVNGLKMYYEIYGAGEPLVLIHGGGSTIQSTFSHLIPMLSKKRQLIAVELQAHGRTSDREAPESFEQDAEDVATLLNNLHIEKASFFGFSNGGNTTMQIGIKHPQLINKLIIASAFYKREGMLPGFFEGMAHATINDMPRSLKDAFLQVNPDSSRLQAMFNKDKERMLHFQDWKDEMLLSIQAPSLIICGDHDVVTTSHTVVMSQLIKNSRLLILPASHGSYMGVAESPYPGSKMPGMMVDIIDDFLNKK